jgi:hypothetical protein
MNKTESPVPYKSIVFIFFLFFTLTLGMSLEVPLDFHGRGFFGKYLNSDTIRYNLDASIEIYCTTLKYGPFCSYVSYRDDLDMAKQTGGVSIDPRYAHYYIIGGLDFFLKGYVVTGYFVHDCVHDIDYDVEGTPVFNRFRLRFSPQGFHYSERLRTEERFLWSIDVGYYPNWDYHGWDINAGADYIYDIILTAMLNVYSTRDFGLDVKPRFTIAEGDTCFYHQHLLSLQGYYKKDARRIGLSLDYNLYNNDPIKAPDKLWLFSLYIEF